MEIEGSVLGTFLRQAYVEFIERMRKKYKISKISVVHPFEGVQNLKNPGTFVYMTEERTQGFAENKEMLALSV